MCDNIILSVHYESVNVLFTLESLFATHVSPAEGAVDQPLNYYQRLYAQGVQMFPLQKPLYCARGLKEPTPLFLCVRHLFIFFYFFLP